jgi:putative flippase GtrA
VIGAGKGEGTMTSIARDPLLAIAKGILWVLMASVLVGAAACVIGVPSLFLFQDQVTFELAKEAPGLEMPQILWVIAAVLVCVVVLLLVLFRIFQLLKRIVDTVGAGDPFVPVNASRLTHMAWLALGVQIVSMAISGIANWLVTADTAHVRGDIEIHGGLSGNGLLLMLILFILARVFRQGAAMRAELEGTV